MNNNEINKGNNDDDPIIIEEDWGSSFPTGFVQHYQIKVPLSPPTSNISQETKTKNNDDDYHHHTSSSSSSKRTTMILNCVESLTPLDMMNLYYGHHDATGHRVWMGALFFIECFACTLPVVLQPPSPKSSQLDTKSDNKQRIIIQEKMAMIDTLSKWRMKLFHKKHILELGAGTGASGLSLIIAGNRHEHDKNNNKYYYNGINQTTSDDHDDRDDIIQPTPRPSSVIFTDSDPAVLDLCIKNMKQNDVPIFSSNDNENDKHKVYQLEWGNSIFYENSNTINVKRFTSPSSTTTTTTIETQVKNDTIEKTSIDCIIATDVIYDISAIKPLFETASLLLKQKGYFILSHVPRATTSSDEDDNNPNHHHMIHKDEDENDCNMTKRIPMQDKIEQFILNIAKTFQFKNIHIDGFGNNYGNHNCCLRPKDLTKIRNHMISSDKLDYDEMEMSGAGIFIFEYS